MDMQWFSKDPTSESLSMVVVTVQSADMGAMRLKEAVTANGRPGQCDAVHVVAHIGGRGHEDRARERRT